MSEEDNNPDNADAAIHATGERAVNEAREALFEEFREKKELRLRQLIKDTKQKNKNIPDQETVTRQQKERALTLENDYAEQIQKLQKGMCYWVRGVVIYWLTFIMAFLWMYTFINMFLATATERTFVLDTEIIITLLATTTVNILGLPGVS